jgi:hypothetical protein
MELKAPQIVDVDLSPHDIQALNGADAVAAFFARLGYNTAARTLQTPNNLGITAEGTTRPVKRIELIADQEALFQIYLFELTSVTISHTRALARSFRNRAGNYLLILTSDYEHIDFVLLEKYLPGDQKDATGIAPKQVSVRPRILTMGLQIGLKSSSTTVLFFQITICWSAYRPLVHGLKIPSPLFLSSEISIRE